jgi:hypothetical protein
MVSHLCRRLLLSGGQVRLPAPSSRGTDLLPGLLRQGCRSTHPETYRTRWEVMYGMRRDCETGPTGGPTWREFKSSPRRGLAFYRSLSQPLTQPTFSQPSPPRDSPIDLYIKVDLHLHPPATNYTHLQPCLPPPLRPPFKSLLLPHFPATRHLRSPPTTPRVPP